MVKLERLQAGPEAGKGVQKGSFGPVLDAAQRGGGLTRLAKGGMGCRANGSPPIGLPHSPGTGLPGQSCGS